MNEDYEVVKTRRVVPLGTVHNWRQRHRLYVVRNGLHGYQCYCSQMTTQKGQNHTSLSSRLNSPLIPESPKKEQLVLVVFRLAGRSLVSQID